jgi:type II secretory pathway pseudopilin PulG
MTPEAAKTILATYRAGALDPANAAAREALELAATNSELAAWWDNEQNFDRLFSRKLLSITPPAELSTTIMRGGATIFFARRLIAESTEDLPEADSAPEENTAEESAETESTAEARAHEAEKIHQRIWRWRIIALAVVGVVGLALVGLFYLVSSQKLAARQQEELTQFAHHAADLVRLNLPSQATGTAPADFHAFLDKNNAPDPAALPLQTAPFVPVGAGADDWSTHHFAYYILQNGPNQIQLFILNRAEFTEDDGDLTFDDSDGSFLISTWVENPFVFVLLRPAPIATP